MLCALAIAATVIAFSVWVYTEEGKEAVQRARITQIERSLYVFENHGPCILIK